MKQKLTYLFSLMLLCILGTSGAVAETVTYALTEGDTFTSGQTVEVKDADDNVVATITYGESGGNDFNAAKASSSVAGFTAFTEGNGTNGNKSGGTFYTIVPKYNGTLEVAVCLNSGKSFYIEENGVALEDYNGITVSEKYNGTYSAEVVANKSYKVYCSGSKLGFYGFKFTPVATYTTVYNLASAIATNGNIEGSTGELAPTTAEDGANAPNIQVDATNGKLGANGDWAQIGKNTVLTLAGVPNGATLTFVLYSNTGITINGTEYTNGETFTSTKDQNLTMTCTTGGYISTITVEGPAFVDMPEGDGYTNTWYFGKSSGAEEFALQGSEEYTYTVDGYSLVINTDAGKLNNASRTDVWAQCNDGTLFKVPVFAGSRLSWGTYNGGSTRGFTIDDQLYNSYYIASEEGTVNMSATGGIGYLSYIKIEPADMYEITGTIAGADVDGAKILLTAANGQVYEATIESSAITATVPADTYSVMLSGNDLYVVSAPESVNVYEDGSIGEITLIDAVEQEVTGNIANAPAEDFVLTFTATKNASNTKTVNCDANATSYTVELMPDTYTMSSSVGTLSTLSAESFQIVNVAVSHNIYFPEEIPAATQQEITVDNTATVAANIYNSVSDALAAAKAGSISSPIITLTSGQTYREQVIVDMANVTLKTSGEEKAKITFYYGIGYTYYSLAANGYYDKDRAMTRNSIRMMDPSRWGATVLVTKNGNGFKADNIIFENSFNQYYTEEEVADGVTPNGAQSITYDRTLTSGETGYKAADTKDVTERAAAIGFENNPTGCELHKCTFIGSQDTFYSSGTLYVKDCDIQGNTDYIFGGGKVVFDNCNLIIGGYSDKEASAYLTAQKGSTGEAYIFRDCTVTKGDRAYTLANLGRDWGGADATVYYFNLTNEIGNKLEYKWTNMGGGVSAGTANLHIYDFDPTVNANYSSTGSTGANVNGLLADDDALSLYADVVTFLGFTPENIYEDNLELADNTAYNVCRIAANNNVERTVDLSRSISADKWSSICLPFDMTEDQLKAAFGENVKVAELSSGDETTLNFNVTNATIANQPYAIKVSSSDSYSGTATISDVTIAYSDAPVQNADVDWMFIGNYVKDAYMPQGSYFFSNNALKLVVNENANKIQPLRGYFTYSAGNAAKALNFTINDGDTTAIGVVNEEGTMQTTAEGKVYNLNGQLVGTPTRGIYVVNGQKVVVD